jgi:hypothetical protein
MGEGGVTIRLTPDEALVLSDWLDRVIGTPEFDGVVSRDLAVWSPLHRIAGVLETSLAEVFLPDYASRLDGARQRLLATLGDLGRPADEA